MSHFHSPSIDSSLVFPLEIYDYRLGSFLNNRNRWHIKLVCRICGGVSNDLVSTTYRRSDDCTRLIEAVNLLKKNRQLVPRIVKLYPEHNTLVCDFVGEFLSEFLLENPKRLKPSLNSVAAYLKGVNTINQNIEVFDIPSIIKTSMQPAKEHTSNFNFLANTKSILPKLKKENVQFSYGMGFQDPHIWNFRIVEVPGPIQALTTDFDYFSSQVNYFWELGYFYATFRWLKKASLALVEKSENILFSLVKRQSLKSKFMFWLGVLSSYCGYEDSLRGLAKTFCFEPLESQRLFIAYLDNKVSYLAKKLLDQKN